MSDVYDFYKPNLGSEYPVVNGPLTINSYLTALEGSFSAYKKKRIQQLALLEPTEIHNCGTTGASDCSDNSDSGFEEDQSGTQLSIFEFDFMVYHTPFGKMTQKAHARLVSNSSQFQSARSLHFSITLSTSLTPKLRSIRKFPRRYV